MVDLDESFHTHRHDAITGAKKKKTSSRTFPPPSRGESLSSVTQSCTAGITGLIDSSSRRGAQRSPRTTGVDVAKQKLLVEEPG